MESVCTALRIEQVNMGINPSDGEKKNCVLFFTFNNNICLIKSHVDAFRLLQDWNGYKGNTF